MSNRRVKKIDRLRRMWRNSGKSKHFRNLRRRSDGEIVRSGGPENYAYGPVTTSKGVLTMHREAERPRRVYASTARSVADLEAMTRDELRALAKDRGLTGYGKLNKAGLVGLLS